MLESTTLPSGGTYHYAYDDRGNQTEVSDDAGNVIFERVYNPDGSIATLTDRFGTVTYDYGAQGMPVRVMGADGTITELDYDILGNVTEVRRGGVTQRFRYDAGGRRLHSDFGNGVTVAYEYDNGDDWTAIQGPTFGRVERRVSSSGRLLSWTEPNGDTFSQTFDASGQLRSRIDELGNVTTYTYDAAGRLESTLDAARGATTSTSATRSAACSARRTLLVRCARTPTIRAAASPRPPTSGCT
ncbi:MAG: RHS repeat protein [Dehalococcoidia bacterium]|nr:RHS repeat protein [Dehalococcoidia bacterium]